MQSVCQTVKNFFPFIYRVILFLIIRHRVQNATIFAKCNAKCYTVNLCTVYIADIVSIQDFVYLCTVLLGVVLSSARLLRLCLNFAGVV